MTNKEIARSFNQLAKVMELHDEKSFRVKTYQNAYITLRKWQQPLAEMTIPEIEGIKGVGKSTAAKIKELLETEEMQAYQKYVAKTPEGVLEMLQIPGVGPKKVKQLWKELDIESTGELLYACQENRLIELNGFGLKTQEDLRKKLRFYQKSKGKRLFADVLNETNDLIVFLINRITGVSIEYVGEMRRLCPIVTKIELLIASEDIEESAKILSDLSEIEIIEKSPVLKIKTENETLVYIHFCDKQNKGSKLFRYTASPDFIKGFIAHSPGIDFRNLSTEEAVFEKAKLPFISPELWETGDILETAKQNKVPQLVYIEDIKGVIHTHTTYSDGLHTLEEMATYAKDLGYEYIVISDHSKAAFYANGLSVERLRQQWDEIDVLNQKLAPFKIFKSIESDILYDGSLDYEEEILQQFDLIIASVHSNLKMPLEKATERLIAAIENPYTTILGHPTGRLLLSREGYPIDHKAVIDACAKNNVVIEMNASPYRLDLDWQWIGYALEKGVKISINPDAHSQEGIHDIRYGVFAARKGGLTKEMCLNALSLQEFEQSIIRN